MAKLIDQEPKYEGEKMPKFIIRTLAIRLLVCRWWQRRKLLMGISKMKGYMR